jgi:predicted CXXCH cytochrome family protein
MSGFRLPPQILRLVLLAIVIGATYAVARVALTPRSFGRYGHYRGAALEEIAAREPTFAGAKACDECHGDEAGVLAKYEHRGISCESCHGPARAHADNPDLDLAKTDNARCIRCHAEAAARPAWLKQIKVADHFTGDRCVECHIPHRPKETP